MKISFEVFFSKRIHQNIIAILERRRTMDAQPTQFGPEVANRLERLYVTAYARERRAAVRAALDLRAGEHVLDLGTGPGFEPYELATMIGPGGHVHALDTSETMLQLSRLEAWLEDLRRAAKEDRYFFCLSQYLYLAAKPTEVLM